MFNPARRLVVMRRLRLSMSSSSSSSSSSPPAPADLAMPTPLSLGFNLTLQKAPQEMQQSGRAVVVLCGWLGAKPRQLRVFQEFYHKHGFDVISFAVGPAHVLRPKSALELMGKVVDLSTADYSKVVFHHFSVGGYLFGQMLRVLESRGQQGANTFLTKLVRAQVFDSPPDIAGVPAGLAASMGIKNAAVSKLIELTVKGYLAATASTSGVEHAAASQSFHNNNCPAPSLWFYSKADPVANYLDCQTVIAKWRARGTVVEECVWEDSKHIQHAKKDPDRYFGQLEGFLRKHQVLDSK